MRSCGALILYIICIPTIITIISTDKSTYQFYVQTFQRYATGADDLQRLLFVNQEQNLGRSLAVRRILGLEDCHLAAVSHSQPAVRPRRLAPRSIGSNLRAPMIKRAIEFIVDDPSSLPILDDAHPIVHPLTLTSDSMWEYGNSKQQILDDFAASFQRDAEEAALTALLKSKPRSRKQRKNKQISLPQRSKAKVCLLGMAIKLVG